MGERTEEAESMSGNKIRIVVPESDSLYTRTQGTKIFVGDTELSGVVKVECLAVPNSLWEATITLQAPPPDISYVGRIFVRPARRWWHRLFKSKDVEVTDLSEVAIRFGKSN